MRRCVSNNVRDPNKALAWLAKVDKTEDVEDLADDEGFPRLSRRLAEALYLILTGQFRYKIQVEERIWRQTGLMISGRQLLWYMEKHFELSLAEGTLLEFQDLTNVKLRGDDLQHFQNRWNYTLGSIGQIPDAGILETLYSGQVKLSAQFKQHFVLYHNGILNGDSKKDYYKSHQVVERCLANVQNEKNRRDLDNAHYHSHNSKNKSK